MKLVIFLFSFLFIAITSDAQTDSLGAARNVGSFEVGGGSYVLGYIGNPFNLGYGRIVQLDKDGQVQSMLRVGIGTDRTISGSRINRLWFTPIEMDLLLGMRVFKADFGCGYTPVFGNQSFLFIVNGIRHYENFTFSSFWNARIGVCVVPVKKYRPFLQLVWTPMFIPKKYPVAESERFFYGQVNIFRAGISLGMTF